MDEREVRPVMAELPDSLAPNITTTATEPIESGDVILTGGVILSTGLFRLSREWQPKDKSAQRWKDDVTRKLEQVLNNVSYGSGSGSEGGGSGGTTPDLVFDSGFWWFRCDHSIAYEKILNHNLGQVPSRYTFIYSNVAEPQLKNPEHDVRIQAPGLKRHVDSVDFVGQSVEYVTAGFFVEIESLNSIKISIAKDYLDGYGTYGIPKQPEAGGFPQGYFRVIMWR